MRWIHWKRAVPLLGLFLFFGQAPAVAETTRAQVLDILKQEIARGRYGFTVDARALSAGGREGLNGYIPPPETEKASHMDHGLAGAEDGTAIPLPARWNWMEHGGVSGVRNQRPAGTCWAFATVATLECNIKLHDGIEEDLSEQYLVSCNNEGLGCNTGGWAVPKYFSRVPPGEFACDGQSGAVLEADFPYDCTNGSFTPDCIGTPSAPLPRPYVIDDFAYVPETIRDIKSVIFKYGPISVSVAVDPYFQAYAGGVFDRNYDSFTNHAVSLVGWDDHQGENGVWYLRNSWGEDWGEDGYMRIAYGCSRVGSDPAYVVYKGGVVNPAGIVALDAAGYTGGDHVGVILRDSDFGGTTQGSLELVTDGGDRETIGVTEADEAGSFFGDMMSVRGPVVQMDGILQVGDQDVIRLRYTDADDGRGGTQLTREAQAWVDCLPPTFSGLGSVSSGHGYVSLVWTEGEDAHPPLTYHVARRGDDPQGTWEHIAAVATVSYKDYGARAGTTFQYRVRVADAVGNMDQNTGVLPGFALAPYRLSRAGLSPAGDPAGAACANPSISGDGTVIAFESTATNLVAGATNTHRDVYVRDYADDSLTLISRGPGGEEGNGASDRPSLSSDGRLVAFASYADNLVGDDTNQRKDVFVFNRQAGDMQRISVSSAGVAANGNSNAPVISADGRFVAFVSFATNLVANDLNGCPDIFVHDRETGIVTTVSCAADGTPGNGAASDPAISADGRYVVFESTAGNLVAEDTNGRRDIFLRDRHTGSVHRLSVSTTGGQSNGNSGDPCISADGRVVVFSSLASNLAANDTNGKGDVFVHDRQAGTTVLISRSQAGAIGLQNSDHPAISGDGRWVVFDSRSSNLVNDDTNSRGDVFRHDRRDDTMERLSMGPAGDEGNGDSTRSRICADGRYVSFYSVAGNLVDGDTNEVGDAFRIGPLGSADTDGDGILDDGDLSGIAGDAPCVSGEGLNCDDNCGATANTGQFDADGDGYGNRCDCDLDNNGSVDQVDFLQFRGAWGGFFPAADFNGDGGVDQVDFMIFRARWGETAPYQ